MPLIKCREVLRPKNENESNREIVFVDDLLAKSPKKRLSFFAKKLRLSISRSSARLGSIQLTEETAILRDEPRLIRRKDDFRNLDDPFKKFKVPDLTLSLIFSNLRRKDLCSVMQVNKKFGAVGRTSLNWTVIDAHERPVSEYSLASIMNTKVRVLSLAGVKADPLMLLPDKLINECFFVPNRIEYLDLSRANLSQRELLIVLRPCWNLVCLSMEGNLLDNAIASCVASNTGLVQLDISMTHGLTKEGAHNIFRNCKKLEQLNASWCEMNASILHVILENITDKIRRLNLAGSERNFGLSDEHIQMLINACPNLVDLDLSDNTELGQNCLFLIIENFLKLQILSINRCYGIDPNLFIHLKKMASLRFLNIHGCVSDTNLVLITEMCQRLKINKQVFNFTAKPVSSTSCCSQIWGHSLKEDVF